MTEQNWEFCELGLEKWKEHKRGLLGGEDGTSYNCYIQYYASGSSEIIKHLAKLDSVLSYDPFSKAMAFLGVNGWELVSVQYGNAYGGQVSHGENGLIWDNKVAFLKRLIINGRKINEPELAF